MTQTLRSYTIYIFLFPLNIPVLLFNVKSKSYYYHSLTGGELFNLKEQVMVIFEKEAAYARELSGYLSRHSKFPYRIATFTGKEALDEYMQSEKPDVLLIGSDMPEVVIPDGVRVIRLSEEPGLSASEPWIYKYQSAGNIMREVAAYSGKEPRTVTNGAGPTFYTVFSAKAGTERTEYARELAADLRRNGPVIYVNMEPFPSEEVYTTSEWKGMSEAIYYLKNGGDELIWKLKGLLSEKDGIKELGPVHCSMDLLEIGKKDVKLLFEVLRSMKEITNVVIDLGFFSEAALEILSESNSIQLVTPGGNDYKYSADFFLKQLKVMQKEALEGRIEVVNYGMAKTEGRTSRNAAPKIRLLAGVE